MKTLLLILALVLASSSGDNTTYVRKNKPMVYETIERFVWLQKERIYEEQSTAYLELESIIAAGNVDQAILSHLLATWSYTVGGVECYDYVTIVDLYKYQIQFTK